MGSCKSFIGCILVLAAVVQMAAAATTHVVGGQSLGWTVPQGNAYTTWAASQTFAVGDTLVFNFNTGFHDVAKVSKEEYDACTSSKPIGSIIMTGPASVTLDTTGDHYYICTFGQHCSMGQKLTVTVASSGASSPNPNADAPSDSTSPPPTAGSNPGSNPNADAPSDSTSPPPTSGSNPGSNPNADAPSDSTSPPPTAGSNPGSNSPSSLAAAGFGVALVLSAISFFF